MAHMSIIGWFIWRLTVQAKDVRLRGSRVDEVHSWMVRIWLELDSWRVVQKFLVGSSNRLIGWNLLLAERRVFEWFLELTQSRHLRDRILLFIYVQNSNKSYSVSGLKLIQMDVKMILTESHGILPMYKIWSKLSLILNFS